MERLMRCPGLLIALLLSRHMRGGLAGAGTATMPRRHGITRPPTPLSGVEPFLLATPTSFTSTCWIYLYHPKSSLAIHLSLQDVSTTVLRDGCSRTYTHN
eukprot:COSAG01_NODE_3217_length_6400_cov_4.602444_4_plen_100_part_00